jgi:CRISPR-associated protein Csm1
MTAEERTLILGALFHDIGKFVQRCTDKSTRHPVKGVDLVNDFSNAFIKILGSENNYETFKEIILTHHEPLNDYAKVCKIADHISASERVDKEENEEGGIDWSNNFLCSLFSKIKLNSDEEPQLRYFRHQQLTKENYNALIPEYDQNDDKAYQHKYGVEDLEEFKTQLRIILNFYKDDSDFNTLINLLLILFEKWLWYVPDFTGSSKTDISLFNHLKDVAGLTYAIWRTKKENPNDETLNLVIGDIPGIQPYIFDVIHKKPAKILRGRSIFVQVLARNFASKFLEKFNLTECNLIMLAGGKFYIIAPNHSTFKDDYKSAIAEIEDYLYQNFRYELGFIAGYENFRWPDLMAKKIIFGEIIDKATENLNSNKTKQFINKFFNQDGKLNISSFILEEIYIEPVEGDSNNIKCKVTDKPIRSGRAKEIQDGDEKILVDKQVKIEYEIGDEITDSNLFLVIDDENKLSIEKVFTIKSIPKNLNKNKLLINPVLDEIIKEENVNKGFLRNTLFLEVANYCSKYFDESENRTVVMPFDKMVEQNDGAKYLTLIKGDIDNLGLIMAYSLVRDKEQIKDEEEEKDLTAISRTTTLSNHLKYFFSFFLNGFLRDWEKKKQKELEENERSKKPNLSDEDMKKIKNENRVYTIFAGGDDLMIICPHSSSLNLLSEFDNVFNEFTVHNPEIHISYSLTNFKHHTPIRIVAEIAEENQKESKKKFTNINVLSDDEKEQLNLFEKYRAILKQHDCFYHTKEKAGTRLFDTTVKNSRHNDLIDETKKLVDWVLDNKNPVSMGTIRNLFQTAEIIKAYEEEKDTRKLIWHPMLTYYLNRNIKGKGKPEVEEFFERVLSIYKDKQIRNLQEILYPVLSEVIYKLRK